jgi:hypothetical protein
MTGLSFKRIFVEGFTRRDEFSQTISRELVMWAMQTSLNIISAALSGCVPPTFCETVFGESGRGQRTKDSAK